MEDSQFYGVTMLVSPPTAPPRCLAELTVVAHTTEAGQQRYYKAEEVEALVALLTAPQWVAVGERLPVDEVDNHDSPFETTLFLVARPAMPYTSEIALGYLYAGDWYIVQEGGGDDADFIDNSVTHWQPRPAAPTVKGDQQGV